MSYLVTGGAGFVGSHVAEVLLQRGEKVLIVDNFNDYYDPQLKHANAQRLAAYPQASIIEGDIRDAALMHRLFAEHGIKRVAHMAAMAGVRSSVTQVELYMAVNTLGTMNLLEAAKAVGVENFVLASTSSVYGATQKLPFHEDDNADRPLAAYPASKRSAELLAYTYHHLFKLNVTVLRFFNVYGPAGRPDMMPMRVLHALTKGETITVFGDGSLARDWTYIEDTVAGVIAALDRPLGYELINLGAGGPITLNEFIETLEDLTGRTAKRESVPVPLSEPPITFCNNEKARRLLDFAPQTPVHEGLAQTWGWFREAFSV
jgi:UDP-glucuronate 4-epimerase